MISKSFLKSSIVFTVGGAMPMLAALILLPFYTNYLSEEHYTQILFYISLTFLFQILFSFSIESYFGIKYSQLIEEPGKQKNLIGTMSVLLLLIGLIFLVVFSLAGNFLFKSIYNDDLGMEFWPYGFYSILTAFFNSYYKGASICLIYLKQPRLFLWSSLINFFVTVFISVGGLFLFPGTIIGPIFGRLLSGVVIFFIGHYIFSKNGIIQLDKSFVADLIRFCTPYLFYVICGWILTQIDRYFLQSYVLKAELNAYDLLLKCFIGVEFIQNSLSAVIFPKLFEIWNKNKKNETTIESNRYFNVFTAVNIIQLILFCICIPVVYKLFIKNPVFYQSEQYIGILAAGYALRSIINFYVSTIMFTKEIPVLLKIFGCSAVLQIVLTLVAVKYYGLVGAIYAGLATKIFQVFFCQLFTKSIFKYSFNYYKIILIPVLYIVINLLQFIFLPEYDLRLYISQFLIFSLIFYLVFKNEIMKVLVSFKILKEK